jgi:hypothetical protein
MLFYSVTDANLGSYGISGEILSKIILSDRRVNVYTIFIAGERNAQEFAKGLPVGHGFVVLDTGKLPKVFKDVFSSSILSKL